VSQTAVVRAAIVPPDFSQSVEAAPVLITIFEPPIITRPPQDRTVPDGWTNYFDVEVTGTEPLAYQWYKDGLELPGQTNLVLTFAAVQPADVGTYNVVVTNRAGIAPSGAARLTVVGAPSIIAPLPLSTNVALGQNVTFQVNAAGTPPLVYQWRKKRGQHSGRNEPHLHHS